MPPPGEMLKKFYESWYAPGNAILVIVGDIDPAATLAKIRQWFDGIPSHPLPPRPAVDIRPVKPESFTLDSNLPYVLGFIAYRLPGTDSPDYAAAQVLGDVLASQRADLYGMVPAGKALAAEFGLAETYPKASVGYGVVALPAGAEATATINEMRQILEKYAKKGVPEDLVAAAKEQRACFCRIPAQLHSGTCRCLVECSCCRRAKSPDEDMKRSGASRLGDVNRVAKQYLVSQNSITATLKPVPSGKPVATKGFGGAEAVTSAPTKPVELPVVGGKRR